MNRDEHASGQVIVHFQTGPEFPDRMPDIVLQTLMSTRNGKCFRSTHNNYPYSPRWSATELAERHRAYLQETMPQFRAEVQQQLAN